MRPVTFALLLLTPGALAGQAPSSSLGGAARADSLLESRYAADEPGVAVMIIKDGSVIYERTIGLADLESGAPITPETAFYIASLGKALTGTAILMLAERGQLSLDDTLGRYLPDAPAYGRGVTLRQMLSHTSGIPDYYDVLGDDVRGVTNGLVLKVLHEQDALSFGAGEDWGYSNSAYVLLSLVVERVSGERFGRFLASNIFEPVGMTRTVVYDETRPGVPGRATGYSQADGGGFYKDDYGSFTTGAGGIFSTLEDLYKWDRALESGQLLGPEFSEAAFTMQRTAKGRPTPFGLGWMVEDWSVGPFVGGFYVMQVGILNGFRARHLRFADRDFTVIMLSNAGKPLGWTHEIPALFLLEEPETPELGVRR